MVALKLSLAPYFDAGYKHEFLQLFGFDRADVDYDVEVEADRRFDCLEL